MTNTDRRRRIVPAMIAVLLAVGGCSTTSGGKEEVGKYPRWLIAAAEPAAPAIGFAISRVQWREGHLNNDEALAAATARLRPLDVLLFSNKGRLSGHTGAGIFGHSAVYLGSERELKAMGLWNDPAIVPHREAIRAGRSSVESAQRHGTALAPVSHIVETDRLVILRPKVDAARRRSAIRGFFGMVGRRFDHHYRLSEQEFVFCTELIDIGLPELNLKRRPTYGREVILPDDMASTAARGRGRLAFVGYLHADRTGWRWESPAHLADQIGRGTGM